MRWTYARALYEDPGATLDDLSEAVKTLEERGTDKRGAYSEAHIRS